MQCQCDALFRTLMDILYEGAGLGNERGWDKHKTDEVYVTERGCWNGSTFSRVERRGIVEMYRYAPTHY